MQTLILVLALLVPAAVFQQGCSRGERPPNVILITLDTVRADHLGCYGYTRNTSPRIDAFADHATQYTHAISSAPWTVPTHASLFTARFSFEHGAHTFEVDNPTANNVNPLSVRFLTIAEALQAEGYETGAFVANAAFLGRRWQLDQGFETYVVDHKRAGVLNQRVFNWLAGRKDQPFFLFVNYMDAHGPYNTSKPAPFLATPAVQDNGELLNELERRVMPGTEPVPEELAQSVIDQYDTAIANLDEQLGVFLDRLQELGLYENSMIVVTSDHGEYFGEHRLVKHSKDVYEEVLQVPLITKDPRQDTPKRVDGFVTSTDIPALIFSQLPPVIATPLLKKFADVPGNHAIIAENYYTRAHDLFHPQWGHRFNRIRTAIYDWPYKFIRSSDNAHELYDLEEDPSESNNLFGESRHSDVTRRLEAKILQFQSSRRRSDTLVEQDPLTEEELEKLRSLGYIGN
jgi:arylsulfatase A-like enzyme